MKPLWPLLSIGVFAVTWILLSQSQNRASFSKQSGQLEKSVADAGSLSASPDSRTGAGSFGKATASAIAPLGAPGAHPKLGAGTEAPTENDLFAAKPDGNLVPFRVVDGLAIAYGDVILGKVESSASGKLGWHEAPQPQLWPTPEIPYSIDPSLPNPKRVEQALEYFKAHTPVRFVPYQGQKDAIVFESGPEYCFSQLGRVGGLQSIRLSAQCTWVEITHEIMHALGFGHEQSRLDRDTYVDIFWENIDPRFKEQFALIPESFMEIYRDSPFDFRSLMIYRPDAFTVKPGLESFRPKSTKDVIQPATDGLSQQDIQRLNKLFSFSERAGL